MNLREPLRDDLFAERLAEVLVGREVRHEPLHDPSHQGLPKDVNGEIHECDQLVPDVAEVGNGDDLDHLEEDRERELLLRLPAPIDGSWRHRRERPLLDREAPDADLDEELSRRLEDRFLGSQRAADRSRLDRTRAHLDVSVRHAT